VGAWAAAIPAIVSAVGSIGSSLLSRGGGSGTSVHDAGRIADANIVRQKYLSEAGLKWQVQGAKNAGLHPLAALGASGLSYNPQHVGIGGDRKGDYDFGRIGQSLGRAIEAVTDKTSREVVQIKLQQERELLRKLKLENIGLAKEVNDKLSGHGLGDDELSQDLGIVGQSSPHSVVSKTNSHLAKGVELVPSQQTISSRIGHEAGTRPLEADYIDEKGRVYNMIGREASEPVESSFYHKMKYGVSKFHGHYEAFKHWRYPDTKEASKHRNWLRNRRKASPSRDRVYVYDAKWGMWRLVKRSNMVDDLYYEKPITNRIYRSMPAYKKRRYKK